MGMGEHLFISGLVMYLAIGIPMMMLLIRAGFSGWWSILVVVPLVNVIALWVFAMIQWPEKVTFGGDRT